MDGAEFGVLHHHDFFCCSDLKSALIFISGLTDRLQITTTPVRICSPPPFDPLTEKHQSKAHVA